MPVLFSVNDLKCLDFHFIHFDGNARTHTFTYTVAHENDENHEEIEAKSTAERACDEANHVRVLFLSLTFYSRPDSHTEVI